MLLGFSGRRGLHAVNTTIRDQAVRRLTSYDILRVCASDRRSIIKATYFKSALSVNSWTYRSPSSFKEATVLLRVNWGC